jgi:hypothetical protein
MTAFFAAAMVIQKIDQYTRPHYWIQ